MSGKSGLFFTILVVMIAMLAPVGVLAQDNQPTDDDVNAIAKQLYCPVCENTPLDVCGTQACIDWRAEIRLKLEQGWSEDEIIQYFVDQHGAQVLPTPPPQGLNLLVYILPPAVLLAGGVVVARALRSWRREPAGVEHTQEQPTAVDPYRERFEEELRKRTGGA